MLARSLCPGILGLCLAACATHIATDHYLGVFDPQEQVPAELYRIRIEGDAGWASDVKYGSGWVPAAQADLLSYDIRPDDEGRFQVTGASTATVDVETRRRFFEIGPTSVSTQPQNGRFVVVMSADPDYFFKKLGMLTRFGQDEALLEPSRRAALDRVRLQRIAAAEAVAETRAELVEAARPAAGGSR